MKGKQIFILLLICILSFTCCSCKSEEEKKADQAKKNWEQTSDEAQMSIYCALIKEYMLLVESLGDNTPYPAMKRSVKGNMMSSGLTQKEALDQAEELLIEERSVFWYGEKAGISTTDEDVANYIEENVLQEIQASDNYATVDEACQREGITFEDTIWAYEDSYKMQYILTVAGISVEDQSAFVDDLVETYRQTDDFAGLQNVLAVCRQMIEENITDKKVLKASEIYYP